MKEFGMSFGVRSNPIVAAIISIAIGSIAFATSAVALDNKIKLINPIVVPEFAAEVELSQDANAGLRAFIRCRACHTVGEGEAHRVGPNLYGVVGRTAGTAEGFPGYSDAMKGLGIVWDDESLAGFLAGPKAYLAGTKMNFPGAKPADIPNLIAYLKSIAN